MYRKDGSTTRMVNFALILGTVVIVGPRTLDGQDANPASHHATVVIALVDELPELRREYAAMVLRRSELSPRDVILLPAGKMDARALDSAIRSLLDARLRQGSEPTTFGGQPFQTITLGIDACDPPDAWAKREFPRIASLVAELGDAPIRDIAGVGAVRSIEYRLPDPDRYRKQVKAISDQDRITMLFVLVDDVKAGDHPASIRIFDVPELAVQPVVFIRESTASPEVIQQAAIDLLALFEQFGFRERSVLPNAPAMVQPVRVGDQGGAEAWAVRVLERLLTAEPGPLAPLGLEGVFASVAYQVSAGILRELTADQGVR